MNYKKTIVLAMPYILTWLMYGDCSTMINESFEDFIHSVVTESEQENFKEFYNDLMYKNKNATKESTRKKQQNDVARLMDIGTSSLEIKNHKLSREVQSYLVEFPGKTNPENTKKAKLILLRYGAYEEFLQQRAMRHNGMMAKAGTYFKELGNKALGWFGSWRGSKSA